MSTAAAPLRAPETQGRARSGRVLFGLLVLFVVSRALVWGAGGLAVARLPMNEGEAFTHLLDGGPLLDMWYRWDAGFYTSIATFGYDWANERQPAADMAFLPVYPALVRLFSGIGVVTGPERCLLSPYLSTCTTVGGVLVSHIASFAALCALFALADRRFGRATAWRAAALFAFTFNSIFLGGVYTEAVFALWAVLVLLLLDHGRFSPAVVLACAAALTRSVGVALVPALLVWAWHNRTGRARWAALAAALLPGVVYAAYIVGAGVWVGDPLAYFSTYQTTWGRAAGSPFDAIAVYFSGEPVSWFGWWVSWIDLAFTAVWLLVGAAAFARFDRVWGVFVWAGVLIPAATGTLLSMPRFGAVLIPVYLVAAVWLGSLTRAPVSWVRWAAVWGANAALWALFVTRFVTWRWIA